MIDLHAHILPGVDDGARDIQDSLEMAAMAADSGVSIMTATPPQQSDRQIRKFLFRETERRFQTPESSDPTESHTLKNTGRNGDFCVGRPGR